jgi:basic amino acid/polyamine antiporter, APA family
LIGDRRLKFKSGSDSSFPSSPSPKISRELKRSINLFQAIMYGVGLILGAGIYVIIGDVAGIAGNAMWISFIVAASIAILTGLSYAELSSIFPRSAAEYVFTKNAFGSSSKTEGKMTNLISFIVGCLIILVALISAATVAVSFSGYFGALYPHIPPVIVALFLVGILSFVNFYGISESIWTNVIFTLIELAGLAVVILAAFMLGSIINTNYYEVPSTSGSAASTVLPTSGNEKATESFISFLQSGAIVSIIGAAGLIFFAYYGFENMANIAEEIKNPSKVIPKALLISIVITTVVYILVALSTVSLVGWKELSSSDAPLAVAAERAFGSQGILMLSVIALFATSNTVLMMLISGSRIIYGISRDGSSSMFPTILQTIHHTRRTPWVAVIIAMGVTMIIVMLSSGNIEGIANVSVFGIFIVYAIVNLSLIVLRYTKPNLKRPFQSPFKLGKFPILAGIGFIVSVAMLFRFDIMIIIAGVSVIIVIVILYIMLKWRKNRLYTA